MIKQCVVPAYALDPGGGLGFSEQSIWGGGSLRAKGYLQKAQKRPQEGNMRDDLLQTGHPVRRRH